MPSGCERNWRNSGVKKKFLLPLCAALLLSLTACGVKNPPILPGDEADIRWEAFVSLSKNADSDATLSGSLRFGPASDTRRVTYLLWSDQGTLTNPGSASRTIRLEISAGLGVNVAKALFKDGQMLLLAPQEKSAYIGRESEENIAALLGLSLPMNMARLEDLLAGRYLSALDVTRAERYETVDSGDIVYHCETAGRPAELTLDAQAKPIRWKLAGHWDLSIGYGDDGRPYKLDGRMQSVQGELRLVLLVKERLPDARPASSLILDIPADFRVYALDQ